MRTVYLCLAMRETVMEYVKLVGIGANILAWVRYTRANAGKGACMAAREAEVTLFAGMVATITGNADGFRKLSSEMVLLDAPQK